MTTPPIIYRDHWQQGSSPIAAAVCIGSVVKLFNGRDRFWTTVVARRDRYVLGVVRNFILSPTAPYQYGDYIEFTTDDIHAILTADEADICGKIAKRLPMTDYIRVIA